MEEITYHKKYGLFSNINYVLKNIKKVSKFLLFLLPVGVVIAIFQKYLWTFITKFVIDLITRDGNFKNLLVTVIIFTLITVLFFFLQTWYYNKKWPLCIKVRMNQILKLNMLMMRMPFQFTEDPEILDCCQKARNALGGNQQGFEGMIHQLFTFLELSGSVITGFVIVGTLNPLVLIGMTLLAVLNFLSSNWANRYTKKHYWDPLANWWRKHWYMNMNLGTFEYAKDIRMFGLKNWLIEKFKELNKDRYRVQQKNCRLWFWVSIVTSILWIIFQAAIYYYLIHRVFSHTITIGNFSLYIASSATFFECISSMLNSITELLQKSREVDDIRSFMENEHVNQEINLNNANLKKPSVPDYGSWEFTFENVSFKYPHSKKYALKNLNIKIKAGERLAVVGLNGAGKSTFIKLLLRLYKPTEGKIYLNGHDVQEYDLDSYFSIFSPVFQDVNLFAFSLAENVSMKSMEETDKKKVEECIKRSDFEGKIDALPKGIDTQLLKVIYDDGTDLSGGQRQKLALARALYKAAPVVVLDEPTAALDALAESKLYNHFDSLIGNKTSIYISHRLSSTQFCNSIAMFKEGQIIEYGTHKSLMALNKEYAKMFKVQSRYYREVEENE